MSSFVILIEIQVRFLCLLDPVPALSLNILSSKRVTCQTQNDLSFRRIRGVFSLYRGAHFDFPILGVFLSC